MSNGTMLCRTIAAGLLLLAAPAFAGPTFSITPAGRGVFLLQGNGLTDTAGIDVQIFFDQSTLANPRITQGSLISGAMTTANVNLPGVVRLSVIGTRAINGTGSVAIINFDPSGTSPGKITSLRGSTIDMAGKTQPVVANLENPPDAPSQASSPDAGENPPPQAASATAPTVEPHRDGGAAHPFIVGSTLAMPKEEDAAPGQEPATPPEQVTPAEMVATEETPVSTPEPPAGASAAKPLETAAEPVQSVLDRFRLFKGERSMEALTALFAGRDGARFSQDPPVGIADGRTSLKVKIATAAGNDAPNFAFSAARAVSVKPADGVWLLEVVPHPGALKAGITVLAGGVVQEFPLTVSPPADVDLDGSGTVTEADFRLFLKERRKEGAPKFDLNGDGRRDYVDDYIFTANYLAALDKQARRHSAPRKAAEGDGK